MIERRPLGKTGIDVGEIGLSLMWDDAIVRRAIELGCNLFIIEGEGPESIDLDVLIARRSGSDDLVFTRGETRIGPEKVLVSPYNLISQETSTELIPKADHSGRGVIADDVLASGALSGPVGHAPPGSDALKYKFLIKSNRTIAQAAVQFVLANEHISCAVPHVSDLAEAEEVLAAPNAEPFQISELEQIFETWAGRCEE